MGIKCNISKYIILFFKLVEILYLYYYVKLCTPFCLVLCSLVMGVQEASVFAYSNTYLNYEIDISKNKFTKMISNLSRNVE